jgi:hypothetical protein
MYHIMFVTNIDINLHIPNNPVVTMGDDDVFSNTVDIAKHY